MNQRKTVLDVRQTWERQAQRTLHSVGFRQKLAKNEIPVAEPPARAARYPLVAAGNESDVAEPRDGGCEGQPEVLLVSPADLGDVPAHGEHALEMVVAFCVGG